MDGVLLGVWVDVVFVCNILDIGIGIGLIFLMMVQWCNVWIRVVDIDVDVVEQVCGNVVVFLWQDRIEVELQDICYFILEIFFDVIVFNFFYFIDLLKCLGKQCNIVWYIDFFDFDKLVGFVVCLFYFEGVFFVIIFVDGKEFFLMVVICYGLYFLYQIFIYIKFGLEFKWVLFVFKFFVDKCVIDDLIIELLCYVYSEEYIVLIKEFYLNMQRVDYFEYYKEIVFICRVFIDVQKKDIFYCFLDR